jgi:nitroreductase
VTLRQHHRGGSMGEAREAVLNAIRNRRSIRQYSDQRVTAEDVLTVLEAGRWAPSGLNNQPWRFVVVRDVARKNEVAEQSRYRKIIQNAPVIITVFLDHEVSYDRVKDCQAIGACLQNMGLAVHALGLGGVWLGEILKNKDQVREILRVPSTFELMAVIAIGHPRHRNQESNRKPLSELIFAEL